jgi:hypothetical protein
LADWTAGFAVMVNGGLRWQSVVRKNPGLCPVTGGHDRKSGPRLMPRAGRPSTQPIRDKGRPCCQRHYFRTSGAAGECGAVGVRVFSPAGWGTAEPSNTPGLTTFLQPSLGGPGNKSAVMTDQSGFRAWRVERSIVGRTRGFARPKTLCRSRLSIMERPPDVGPWPARLITRYRSRPLTP